MIQCRIIYSVEYSRIRWCRGYRVPMVHTANSRRNEARRHTSHPYHFPLILATFARWGMIASVILNASIAA